MASIPDAMGIINCTHVHLFPSGHKEHIYKNRKGYHSMNIQVVCDIQMLIRYSWGQSMMPIFSDSRNCVSRGKSS